MLATQFKSPTAGYLLDLILPPNETDWKFFIFDRDAREQVDIWIDTKKDADRGILGQIAKAQGNLLTVDWVEENRGSAGTRRYLVGLHITFPRIPGHP